VAFIRHYMTESGDPFRFRLPRFIRPPKKIRAALGKGFRLVKKVAPVAAFVPGLQPLALASRLGKVGKLAGIAGKIGKVRGVVSKARGLAGLVQQFRGPGQPEPEAVQDDVQELPAERVSGFSDAQIEQLQQILDNQQFARGYGYDQGDPVNRRKAAAAGPAVKAHGKSNVRTAKAMGAGGPTGPQKRRPGGGSKAGGHTGLVMGANPRLNLHALLRGGANLIGQSGIAGALDAAHARDFGGGGGGGGGGHRRVNPGNVKALRRSLRRVEGFAKLATKVQKDAAKILRHVHREPGSSRRGGHRAGCRCVACKNR
jgi:hypothetical protein